MNISKKEIDDHFSKNEVSTYSDFAKFFSISVITARTKLMNKVSSSLNFKGKYITLIKDKNYNKYGLLKIKTIVFSNHGTIKKTLSHIIEMCDKISSKELYNILFNLKVSQQLTSLLKDKQIFAKKEGRTYLYSLNPFSTELIREEEFEMTSLKEGDKILRDLQIIKELQKKKKVDVAKKHNISTKTISNIEDRFNKGGVKGLIHSRKPEIKRISSSIQAAIITEAAIHPEKSSKEIKRDIEIPKKVQLKEVNKLVIETRKSIESKKKIFLEIQ